MANYPTDKQINYILRLCNGRHDWDAYAEIAKDMGCSTSAAQRRATKGDASKTIDRLSRGKSYAAPARAARTAYGDYL